MGRRHISWGERLWKFRGSRAYETVATRTIIVAGLGQIGVLAFVMYTGDEQAFVMGGMTKTESDPKDIGMPARQHGVDKFARPMPADTTAGGGTGDGQGGTIVQFSMPAGASRSSGKA